MGLHSTSVAEPEQSDNALYPPFLACLDFLLFKRSLVIAIPPHLPMYHVAFPSLLFNPILPCSARTVVLIQTALLGTPTPAGWIVQLARRSRPGSTLFMLAGFGEWDIQVVRRPGASSTPRGGTKPDTTALPPSLPVARASFSTWISPQSQWSQRCVASAKPGNPQDSRVVSALAIHLGFPWITGARTHQLN